jgi:hypothetical protein
MRLDNVPYTHITGLEHDNVLKGYTQKSPLFANEFRDSSSSPGLTQEKP